MDLDKLRIEIDDIDKNIVELFEKRMKIVEGVAYYKYQNNINILNREREKQVVEKNIKKLNNKDYKVALEEFFYDLMKISRNYQSNKIQQWDNEGLEIEEIKSDDNIKEQKLVNDEEMLNIVYQGVPGSFSYEALESFFNDEIKENKVNKINVESFGNVFEEIQNGKADFGVLPIENSSTGGISDVYDLLRENDLYIVGEVKVKVEHNLLGIKGSTIEDIEEVYSHPQGLEQSKEFLSQHNNWKNIPYLNTAASAKLIKETGDITKGCIASIKAKEIYELELLSEKINFNGKNYTRFVIIGNNTTIASDYDKVSIVLSVMHKSGALHNILTIFKKYSLNMMKIESRPIIERPWEYFFYIDFEGNISNDNVKKAIDEIKRNSKFNKYLGNYKMC
ncbi:chorismate mutase [Clostridium sp. DL1XJH146]